MTTKDIDAQALGNQVDNLQRAVEWLLGGDTGISSEAICAYMLGVTATKWGQQPPGDAADRGRCIRLLAKFPEWDKRLDEMASLESGKSFVIDAKGMRVEHNSWAKQIPLIRQEQLTGLQPSDVPSQDKGHSEAQEQSLTDSTNEERKK